MISKKIDEFALATLEMLQDADDWANGTLANAALEILEKAEELKLVKIKDGGIVKIRRKVLDYAATVRNWRF